MPKREDFHVWVQRFKGRKNLMLQWIDPETGRRKSQSAETDDPEKAKLAAAVLQDKLTEGRYRETNKLTWQKFRERYENEKGDNEKNLSKACTVFDRFEKEVNPHLLSRVNERMITTFTAKLREAKLSPSTIKGYLAYIKVALRWAKSQKLIHDVPHIAMPKVPKGTHRAKVQRAAKLRVEELEKLLMFSPNDGWRLMILLAWHCGMRRTEARTIRGEHIDLETHTIAIPKNKAGDVSDRVIITPEFDAVLREMFPHGIPSGELMHEVPTAASWISDRFRNIARKANVQCTLHDLRRAYGTRLAPKVPSQILQRMMRHASLQTTLDFYADIESAAMGLIWQKVTSDVTEAKSKRQDDGSGNAVSPYEDLNAEGRT